MTLSKPDAFEDARDFELLCVSFGLAQRLDAKHQCHGYRTPQQGTKPHVGKLSHSVLPRCALASQLMLQRQTCVRSHMFVIVASGFHILVIGFEMVDSCIRVACHHPQSPFHIPH